MMHATVSATAPSALAHRLWPVAQAARLTRFTRLAAGIGTAALLAACSILPAPTPVDTYVLPGAAWQRAATTEHTRTHPAAAGAALRIARPVTDGLLSSRRIAVMPQADRLQVYQGALWSNPPATLLRSRLLDAFLADGRLPWIDTDESPASGWTICWRPSCAPSTACTKTAAPLPWSASTRKSSIPPATGPLPAAVFWCASPLPARKYLMWCRRWGKRLTSCPKTWWIGPCSRCAARIPRSEARF